MTARRGADPDEGAMRQRANGITVPTTHNDA
jgi:hypothetical protein